MLNALRAGDTAKAEAIRERFNSLDVATALEAIALADALRGHVGGFKIGSQLFTSEGPAVEFVWAEGQEEENENGN